MGKQRWAVGLSGAIAGCVGAVLTLDAIDHTRVRSQLQEVADNAALAGVLALASNPNQEAAMRAATVAATQEVEKRADPGAVTFLVAPSKSDLAVSVRVSSPEPSRLYAFLHGANPTDVVSHANFSPPTDPQPRMTNRLHGWKTYAQSDDQQ